MASFEEYLTCPVCHDMITDSRKLPCGHSFCYACIKAVISNKRQSYPKEMECPYCRDRTSIDNLDMTLKPNYMVNNIVNAIKCSRHNMCARHPTCEMDYYCEQCEVLVCSHCAVRDHYGHGKAPKALNEMVGIVTAQMESLMMEGEEQEIKCAEYRTSLGNIRSEGDQEFLRLEDEVMAEYNIHQKQLDEQKDRLLASITTMKSDFRQGVGSVLSADEELMLRVSESLRIARDSLLTSRPPVLVSSFKESAKKLMDELVNEVPNTMEEEGALKMLKMLCLRKSGQSESRPYEIGSIRYREPSDLKEQRDSDISGKIDGADNKLDDGLYFGAKLWISKLREMNPQILFECVGTCQTYFTTTVDFIMREILPLFYIACVAYYWLYLLKAS